MSHPSTIIRRPASAPDLARQAAAVFVVSNIAHLIVMFSRGFVGQIFPQLMAEFRTTGVGITVLSTSYFYVYMFLQIPAGLLVEHAGPRRVISGGLALGTVGYVVFALAPTLGTAAFGRFLSGVGLASIFIAILKNISNWFPAHRYGAFSGISTLVGNVGVLSAMYPFVVLTTKIGWRTANLLVAAVCAFTAAWAWVVVRDRGPYSDPEAPADVGAAERTRDLGRDPVWPDEGAAHQKPRTGRSLALKIGRDLWDGTLEVVANPGSWPSLIGFGVVFGTLMTFTSLWGGPFLMQAHGLSQAAAGSILATSAVGAALAAPTVGIIVDKVKNRRLVLAGTAAFQIPAWLLLSWSSAHPASLDPTGRVVWILRAAIFIFGVSNASFLPSFIMIRAANRPAHAGLAQGLANFAGFLGVIVGQTVVSLVMDSRWEGAYFAEGVRGYPVGAFVTGFGICAAAVVAVIIFVLVAGRWLTRREQGPRQGQDPAQGRASDRHLRQNRASHRGPSSGRGRDRNRPEAGTA
ncbi:MAG: MFS transporter [Firmicutes bacterium]|nr:MFS transporter [Bacillota bacterium]